MWGPLPFPVLHRAGPPAAAPGFWQTAGMAEKRPAGDNEEPTLELPKLFGRRKKRSEDRLTQPAAAPAPAPEPAPAPAREPAPARAPAPDPPPPTRRRLGPGCRAAPASAGGSTLTQPDAAPRTRTQPSADEQPSHRAPRRRAAERPRRRLDRRRCRTWTRGSRRC